MLDRSAGFGFTSEQPCLTEFTRGVIKRRAWLGGLVREY